MTEATANLPVYGIYLNSKDRKKPLSKVDFSFTPIDFIAHWQRCGTTANFLAEFQSFNYGPHRSKVTSILSTVLNEVIENAIKFSADAYREVSLTISNFAETISIQVQNSSSKRQAEKFEAFVKDLMSQDAESLFINQIIKNSESNKSASQLGLITMKKDFNAQIGVKIMPDLERKLYNISLKIVLDTEELEKL